MPDQPQLNKNRVLILINKWWECDPIIGALLHAHIQPENCYLWPVVLNHPRKRPKDNQGTIKKSRVKPRAIFGLRHVSIEVWCISDLLERYLLESREQQSSSERKAEELRKVFADQRPALVVAAGTTAFHEGQSENGSVVIGTRIFMHNVHPNGQNPYSNWTTGPFGVIVDSALSAEAFQSITTGLTSQLESLLIRPPLNPAEPQCRLISDYDGVSLTTANVTRSADYERADQLTLSAYYNLRPEGKAPRGVVISIETTFGVIRAHFDVPFIFVGGIVDRAGHFEEDVREKEYAQKMVASHNLGVVLTRMIRTIDLTAATGFVPPT